MSYTPEDKVIWEDLAPSLQEKFRKEVQKHVDKYFSDSDILGDKLSNYFFVNIPPKVNTSDDTTLEVKTTNGTKKQLTSETLSAKQDAFKNGYRVEKAPFVISQNGKEYLLYNLKNPDRGIDNICVTELKENKNILDVEAKSDNRYLTSAQSGHLYIMYGADNARAIARFTYTDITKPNTWQMQGDRPVTALQYQGRHGYDNVFGTSNNNRYLISEFSNDEYNTIMKLTLADNTTILRTSNTPANRVLTKNLSAAIPITNQSMILDKRNNLFIFIQFANFGTMILASFNVDRNRFFNDASYIVPLEWVSEYENITDDTIKTKDANTKLIDYDKDLDSINVTYDEVTDKYYFTKKYSSYEDHEYKNYSVFTVNGSDLSYSMLENGWEYFRSVWTERKFTDYPRFKDTVIMNILFQPPYITALANGAYGIWFNAKIKYNNIDYIKSFVTMVSYDGKTIHHMGPDSLHEITLKGRVLDNCSIFNAQDDAIVIEANASAEFLIKTNGSIDQKDWDDPVDISKLFINRPIYPGINTKYGSSVVYWCRESNILFHVFVTEYNRLAPSTKANEVYLETYDLSKNQMPRIMIRKLFSFDKGDMFKKLDNAYNIFRNSLNLIVDRKRKLILFSAVLVRMDIKSYVESVPFYEIPNTQYKDEYYVYMITGFKGGEVDKLLMTGGSNVTLGASLNDLISGTNSIDTKMGWKFGFGRGNFVFGYMSDIDKYYITSKLEDESADKMNMVVFDGDDLDISKKYWDMIPWNNTTTIEKNMGKVDVYDVTKCGVVGEGFVYDDTVYIHFLRDYIISSSKFDTIHYPTSKIVYYKPKNRIDFYSDYEISRFINKRYYSKINEFRVDGKIMSLDRSMLLRSTVKEAKSDTEFVVYKTDPDNFIINGDQFRYLYLGIYPPTETIELSEEVKDKLKSMNLTMNYLASDISDINRGPFVENYTFFQGRYNYETKTLYSMYYYKGYIINNSDMSGENFGVWLLIYKVDTQEYKLYNLTKYSQEILEDTESFKLMRSRYKIYNRLFIYPELSIDMIDEEEHFYSEVHKLIMPKTILEIGQIGWMNPREFYKDGDVFKSRALKQSVVNLYGLSYDKARGYYLVDRQFSSLLKMTSTRNPADPSMPEYTRDDLLLSDKADYRQIYSFDKIIRPFKTDTATPQPPPGNEKRAKCDIGGEQVFLGGKYSVFNGQKDIELVDNKTTYFYLSRKNRAKEVTLEIYDKPLLSVSNPLKNDKPYSDPSMFETVLVAAIKVENNRVTKVNKYPIGDSYLYFNFK
jgi:hypothetical protein